MGDDYRLAADELVAISNADREKRHALRDPTYYLYFHALESGLKGFLLLNGVKLDGARHDLMDLYRKAVAVGLGREGRALTVVSALDDANTDHALRYFTVHSTGAPELGWTKEVMLELMESIRSAVEAIDPCAFKPGPAITAQFTYGRITPDRR
jgi:hypothetical protein